MGNVRNLIIITSDELRGNCTGYHRGRLMRWRPQRGDGDFVGSAPIWRLDAPHALARSK